ncbi:ribonuclease P 40kDa subunit-domain-containing protein [Pholiota molesta]|nr:ribonuclease P 40kDa subunit-domain-containing protein [Pholiota molesta]
MDVSPSSTKRRVKVTSGSLPSSKIHTLAACHPFSQQLDIIFPTPKNPSFCDALEKIETGYGKGKARLCDVVNSADAFLNSGEGSHDSNLLVVTTDPHTEDSWCIDPRGHLTLSVSKETYERLGLVGRPLPFKGHDEKHTIDIPLHKNAQSPAFQARVKAAMAKFDHVRAGELGVESGTWDVIYCSKGPGATSPTTPFQDCQWHRVQCTKNDLQDVHVPILSLSPRPSPTDRKMHQSKKGLTAQNDLAEALDDWNRRTESLFEWVGMACLGAQRLNANDRVDPYVALYEPPEPTRVQGITHLRWRGLLAPGFVKDVLDTLIKSLQAPAEPQSLSTLPDFVSVTAHALTSAPVSYIPYTQSVPGGALQSPPPEKVPAKVPTAMGEDTWSLVLGRQSDGLKWCLAESVGQGDARWG